MDEIARPFGLCDYVLIYLRYTYTYGLIHTVHHTGVNLHTATVYRSVCVITETEFDSEELADLEVSFRRFVDEQDAEIAEMAAQDDPMRAGDAQADDAQAGDAQAGDAHPVQADDAQAGDDLMQDGC